MDFYSIFQFNKRLPWFTYVSGMVLWPGKNWLPAVSIKREPTFSSKCVRFHHNNRSIENDQLCKYVPVCIHISPAEKVLKWNKVSGYVEWRIYRICRMKNICMSVFNLDHQCLHLDNLIFYKKNLSTVLELISSWEPARWELEKVDFQTVGSELANLKKLACIWFRHKLHNVLHCNVYFQFIEKIKIVNFLPPPDSPSEG
jgi:hypothetical protein